MRDDIARPGTHETEIRKHFGRRVTFDGSEPVFDEPLYLLAFTNRSGSNLFADYLRSLPYFGGFHEQLIHINVVKRARLTGVDSFPAFIQKDSTVFGKGHKSWGFKASWDQMAMLFRFGIHRMYPSVRVFHIFRQDVVAQAVSLMIARETGQWTSEMHIEGALPPAYDYRKIRKMLDHCTSSDANIRTVCAVLDLPTLPVVYEDLVADPRAVMERAAAFAGQDLAGWNLPTPSIRKQATGLNAEMATRFLSDHRARLDLKP